MKHAIPTCLIVAGVILSGGQARADEENLPPPVSGKVYDIKDIHAEAFDLQGKIIRLKYQPWHPRQISSTEYADNLTEPDYVKDPAESIYIILPSDRFRKFLTSKKKQKAILVFAKVSIGKVENQFGAERERPILTVVGRNIVKGFGGKISYK